MKLDSRAATAFCASAALLVLLTSGCGGEATADPLSATAEWRHYAADRASSKYSPASQIDASNVASLEVAWRWTTPDAEIETDARVGNLKGTPLMVNGVLYAVSALNLVSAIDPVTGEELWSYDRVAVMERGRLTETGTIPELLDRRGAFHRLSVEQGASARLLSEVSCD